MNNSLLLNMCSTKIESDDFALTELLQKIQNGEEVAMEEFQNFLNKGKEIVSMLQNSLKSVSRTLQGT